MMQKKFGIAVVAALLASPLAAQAQRLEERRQGDECEGQSAAGPFGRVVGGVVGGVTGGVGAVLGGDDTRRFNDFALREHRSSYRYDEQLRPGVRLPLEGVTYDERRQGYGGGTRWPYEI